MAYIFSAGDLLQPKKAILSSLHYWFGAENCIDGNIGEGKICHTHNDRYPWIAIDYGTAVNVQKVKIFNRADCCGERTRNVHVRISDNIPTSGSGRYFGGTLLGQFQGPAENGQKISITGENLNKVQKKLEGIFHEGGGGLFCN